MKTTAIKFLRKQEWSMGNGQCPECEGSQPASDSNPRGWWTDKVGHEKTCKLALSIQELGGNVQWEKENNHPNRKRFDELDKQFAESFAKANPHFVEEMRKSGLLK